MSEVALILIMNNEISLIQNHFRIIEKIIQSIKSFQIIKNSRNCNLDEGYILYDFDRKLIINSQLAFKLEKQNYEVINLF